MSRYKFGGGLTEAAANAAYVRGVGTFDDLTTDANTARPSGNGPVYWLMAEGVTPVNAVDGDLIFHEGADAALVASIVAGDGVSVDATDPANPVVSSIGGLVASSESDTSVTNDGTDKTLATFATPTAPAFAAGERLIFRVSWTYTNNTGGNGTPTYRIKIGGTTLSFQATGNIASSATARHCYIEVVIALVSPSSQRVGGFLMLGFTASGVLGNPSSGTLSTPIVGAATEDFATSKNIEFAVSDVVASVAVTKAASLERIAKL